MGGPSPYAVEHRGASGLHLPRLLASSLGTAAVGGACGTWQAPQGESHRLARVATVESQQRTPSEEVGAAYWGQVHNLAVSRVLEGTLLNNSQSGCAQSGLVPPPRQPVPRYRF